VRVPYFQVNAFTSRITGGNPAGVCLLKEWLPDEQLQQIAAGGMLPETAFVVPDEDPLRIRWFSPVTEVDLCGHASIAAAHVLLRHLQYPHKSFQLHHADGALDVEDSPGGIRIGLPVRVAEQAEPEDELFEGLGHEPEEVLKAIDYLVVLDNEAQVRNLKPNIRRFLRLSVRGVIITAPGNDVDFVSRFFAPKLGIPEDHVTGSAHCTLMPYWAERLGRTQLRARQLSHRGGELECELIGERVMIGGSVITFIEGEAII
jgi:PhzF family phenazine biosynthesis protein